MNVEEKIEELDKPYKSREVLEHLYWEEELGTRDVADKIGCSSSTVRRWLDKHNLGCRTRLEGLATSHAVDRATFYHDRVYESWKDNTTNESVLVHQLLAVADGADPNDVWDDDKVVHHKCGIPWMNIPGMVEVLDRSDHNSTHNHNEWDLDSDIPQIKTKHVTKD